MQPSCLPVPCCVAQERRDGRALLSRESLIADIEKKGLLSLVPPEVKQIFGLLEADFNPLQLCKVVAPLLDKLKELNQTVSGESAAEQERSGCECGAELPGAWQVLARRLPGVVVLYSMRAVSE